MKRLIVIVANNIRSAYNVGSILRTADGLGVEHIYLTGFTPSPISQKDQRLPHLAQKVGSRIAKTSLGAENHIRWSSEEDAFKILKKLRKQGYELAALEQTADSINLEQFKPTNKIALLLGSEVGGVSNQLLELVDIRLEIPMLGQKDSYNVSVATAIVLYHLRFWQK